MLFLILLAAFLPILAVSAENFTILVGKDGKFTYEPPEIVVHVGDRISFRFITKNHTVTQSTFAKPCEPYIDPVTNQVGLDSGFQRVLDNATSFPQWTITIKDTLKKPLWFHCRQSTHCKQGMVFAINASRDQTFDDFLAKAKGLLNGDPLDDNPKHKNGATGLKLRLNGGAASLTLFGLALGLLL